MRSAVALMLADARLPADGYGLERAVGDGLGVDGVAAAFMGARLRLVARADAAISIAARRAAAGDDTELARLDEEHAARCPNPLLRDAARRLGARLLRSAASAWPCAVVEATAPRRA
jgi:urease accessory protein